MAPEFLEQAAYQSVARLAHRSPGGGRAGIPGERGENSAERCVSTAWCSRSRSGDRPDAHGLAAEGVAPGRRLSTRRRCQRTQSSSREPSRNSRGVLVGHEAQVLVPARRRVTPAVTRPLSPPGTRHPRSETAQIQIAAKSRGGRNSSSAPPATRHTATAAGPTRRSRRGHGHVGLALCGGWPSTRLITADCSMSAMSRSRAAHRGHAKTSSPNVRCIRTAHDRLRPAHDFGPLSAICRSRKCLIQKCRRRESNPHGG